MDQEIVVRDREFPMPLLSYACERKAFKVVDYLLKGGANLNRGVYYTPLHAAVRSGEVRLIERLIRRGANPDRATQAWTPLMHATANGQSAIIDLLIKRGAGPDRKTKAGSPLYWAVERNSGLVVEQLLRAGARDAEALFPAIHRRDVAMVIRLTEAGVDVNPVGRLYESAQRRTALEFAILRRHLDSMLQAGIEQTARKSRRNSSNSVGGKPESEQHLNIIKRLIEYGANPNARTLMKSPLYLAVEFEDLNLVRLLLNAGADPNKAVFAWRGEYDRAALHEAVKQRNMAIVEALLSAGADLKKKSCEGKTPGQLARKNSAIARLLGRFMRERSR